MQTNKQVLRAMVESEEVSLQATAEARERSAVLSATGRSFHSLGARRANCLGRVNEVRTWHDDYLASTVNPVVFGNQFIFCYSVLLL